MKLTLSPKAMRPASKQLLVGVVLINCLLSASQLPGATHTSNGNGLGYTDVGAFYEVMYDPTMWAKAGFGGFSLDYLPLCPKSLVFSSGWSVDTARPGCINNDSHFSNIPGASVQYTFTGTRVKVIGELGPACDHHSSERWNAGNRFC